MKFDLLSIIPYFGGDSPASHSLKQTRLNYFLKTYDNLINISDKIVVSVCGQEDLETINNLNLDCEIRNFQGTNPIFLPYITVSDLQNRIENTYVYYTEADQMLFIKNYDMVFNILDENKYLVPQRLEKIYKHFGSGRGETVKFNKATYVVCNKTGVDSYVYKKDARLYVNTTEANAFGGAFLCHRDLFNRVAFQASNKLPIEHTSGFDIFYTPGAVCLKTNHIFDFFVDHLSGYEYHVGLSGEKITY